MRSLEVEIPVLVERLPNGMMRALSVLPMQFEMVGENSKDLGRKLRAKILREIRRLAPTSWVTGRVWSEVHTTKERFVVEPPPKSIEWRSSLTLYLDTFRLVLGGDQQCLMVPLLDLCIVGKANQFTEELFRQQVHAALDRRLKKNSVQSFVQALDGRRFYVKKIRVPFEREETDPQRKVLRERSKFRKRTATLRSIAIDLTEENRGDEIHCIDDWVKKCSDWLLDAARPSLLLVAPSGAGKTSLVHRLAKSLQGAPTFSGHLWSTSGARIVSGMCGLGMWQQRVHKILGELRDTDGILHVGGLMELIEAGKIQGQPGVASMLRSAISNGRIQIIAEVTPDQLGLVEKEDPILLRSLLQYSIPHLDRDAINEILVRLGQGRVSYEVASELQNLFQRFASDSALPAPAIQLLKSVLQESKSNSLPKKEVTLAFANQTGLPQFLLDDEATLDLDAMRHELASHVIGQAEPIDIVVNLFATFKARLTRSDRPLASLVFIGPTGVGKTEMAKAVAKIMYNDPGRLIRIDMSEYSTPWSSIRLIGRPGEGDGTLVSPIREQPFSVVLLDEFEKADSAVFELLLQLLGEGRLTDSTGRLADFRNAIVILTSNLGVESFRSQGFGFAETGPLFREHFEKELQKFVRPEFLGRIDRIVPFHPLSPEVVREIVQRELKIVANRSGLKDSGTSFQFDPQAVDRIAELGYVPRYGARPIRRAIENHVVFPLACQLAKGSKDSPGEVRVVTHSDRVAAELIGRKIHQDHEQQPQFDLLNDLRDLRHKAKRTLRSDLFRHLENEIERIRRQRLLIEKELRATKLERKRRSLQMQLGMIDKSSHDLLEKRSGLEILVDQIVELEHRSALDWMSDRFDERLNLKTRISEMEEKLRNAILQLQGERGKTDASIGLMILGKELKRASLLWESYQILANEGNWGIDFYYLLPYDPFLDDESEAFRKREARGSVASNITGEALKPTLRLSGFDDHGVRQKWIDAFRMSSPKTLELIPPHAVGIALRFQGEGVASWLEEESGVHHFLFDARGAPSRRWRFRVDVFQGPLVNWDVPSNWRETPALQERDPRRTYHEGYGTILDHLANQSILMQESAPAVALAHWIREQREEAVWKSVGYFPLPKNVRYGSAESEIENEGHP